MKEISCAEVGFFPDCPDVMRGASDEAAMAAAAEHGRRAHGMTDADFTDENLATIRSHIKDV
jgi:predicted small metal-binding protein